MATLTLYQAFDFRLSQDRLWNATLSPTLVTLDSGQYKETMSGTFTYASDGSSFSGTASGAALFINNAQVYGVTGLSHDAWQIALLAGNPGQTQNLYAYLFNGSDTMNGSAGADALLGYAGDDTISAGGGNDWLSGGAGNDKLDGQTGLDTAAYSGNRNAYTVTRTASGFTVTDSRGIDGTDTLAGVERLVFGDKSVALDVDASSNGGKAYRLYQAAFNRTPDADGVGYWMSAMDKGMSLATIAEGFISSKEYKDAYGTDLGNRDLVTKYYQNILHRVPDQGGLDFWVGVLDAKGAPLADVLAQISESKENIDGTAVVIGNGFEYTPWG